VNSGECSTVHWARQHWPRPKYIGLGPGESKKNSKISKNLF
jgi:hypothetical protein